MTRPTVLAALAVAAPLLAGCGQDPDPALVRALADAAAPALFAPELDGNGPRSFLLNTYDDSLTLDYGSGFTPTLTLRAAPAGSLCDGRKPRWDRCTVIDADAVRLSFEEMDAVVVRRDGTELFWSNLSFEMPDEDYPSEQALDAAIDTKVATYVDAARKAPALTAEQLVREVPKGKVGMP